MDLVSLLRARDERLVARDEGYVDDPARLIHVADVAARPERLGDTARPLPEPVLRALGVDRLWSHQAAALDLVREGTSVALATATASGKSLVYQAAIAEAALDPVRPGTALCVYPTKALAHDQWRAFARLDVPGLVPVAYDGDLGRDQRGETRRNATVVLTNPEMLHYGILPHHARWIPLLARLRYVVIDEMHLFRGVFGSHVAHVLRRLRRLAAHYGADPVFVCTSATIGAPAALASALTGVDVVAVTDDGSPSGARSVAVWNPPLLDAEDGVRASSHTETAGLVGDLAAEGVGTVGFCPSRRTTEVVAERARRRLEPARRGRIVAYRGGYLADERHEIEERLAAGALDGVVTTSALEVGVDFHGLDACVLDGFPGTVSAFWQRVGRTGRHGQDSLAVLVCGGDQLDQWIAANPSALTDRTPEPVVINPANPHIADPHIRCAAFELPLTHADEALWPGILDDSVRRLVGADELLVRPPGGGTAGGRGRHRRLAPDSPVAVWQGAGWPVDGVGLRSGSTGQVDIVRVDGTRVGTVDRSRATQTVHEGAVYLHAGQHYRVIEFDPTRGPAVVEPDDGTTYTTVSTRLDLRLGHPDQVRDAAGLRLAVGPVSVTTRILGYTRHDALTHEVRDRHGLSLPPAELETRGVWRVVPTEVLLAADVHPDAWPGALHAAEHAAIGVLPLIAVCDRWDVGGVSTARHVDTGAPTIVIYDGYPGGAGIADLAFAQAEEHWRLTGEVIAACRCERGCPSCVQSPKCGNGNDPLDKVGARRLLAATGAPGAAGGDPRVARAPTDAPAHRPAS